MTTDKFGFMLGKKRSKAAVDYERGATQQEMISLTGARQYNMLRDAIKRGHRVFRDGDRFWLISSGAVEMTDPKSLRLER